METDYAYYQVMRSSNNGDFWSNLTSGQELDWDAANYFMDKEQEKHPSDWLRLVKVQATTIRDYTGNEKKKKDVFMNGMTAEEYIRKIEEAHEISKGSQLRFK